MKTASIFTLTALFALSFASCSKEVDNGMTGAEGDAMVTFTVKTQKGSFVTYADIATPAEWAVNSVDVYAFAGGNLIGGDKMDAATAYDVTKNGNTTTIRVKGDWLAPYTGQTLNFYFVGNDDGHVPATVPTSETAFKALVTKELNLDVNDHAALITTPLLFSATQSVTLDRRLEIPVQLKRREARFDIVNKYDPATQLVINKITALNTNIAGYLFSTGSGATFTQKHSQTITVPTGAAWVKSQEGTPARDIWTAGSVMYFYPGKLGKAADGDMELIINATMGTGTPTDYTLAAGSQINIIANNRYKIILDPLSLTFIVAPADWEEGGNLETVTGGDDTFSGFTATADAGIAANWNDATKVYKFDDNATGNLSVIVNSTYGSSYKVTYSMGDESNVTFADPNVSTIRTYAGQETTDTYTIAVPTLKVADGKAYSIRLEIFSPGGEAKEMIVFSRGTLDENYVKDAVNDDKLAEAVEEIIKGNAGKGDGDAITPDDIEKTTELDLSGKTDINSIEGLDDLFPNLEVLNALGCDLQDEVVDLTKYKNLKTILVNDSPKIKRLIYDENNSAKVERLHFRNTGISELDLTDFPKLQYLDLSKTPILSLDFSQCPDLQNLQLQYSQLTEIDLSKQHKLHRFWLGRNNLLTKIIFPEVKVPYSLDGDNKSNNCYIYENPLLTTIENLNNVSNAVEFQLTKHPVLNMVDLDLSAFELMHQCILMDSDFTSLDISKSKALKYLNLSNIEDITVYVWQEFDTETPKNTLTTYYGAPKACEFIKK